MRVVSEILMYISIGGAIITLLTGLSVGFNYPVDSNLLGVLLKYISMAILFDYIRKENM